MVERGLLGWLLRLNTVAFGLLSKMAAVTSDQFRPWEFVRTVLLFFSISGSMYD